MEDIVDYRKAINRDYIWLMYEADRLRVLAAMTRNPACKEIMAVYQHDKNDPEAFEQACMNVWRAFDGADYGSLAMMKGQRDFIAEVIPLLVQRHQAEARQVLEAQIEKTKLDLERLEAQREVE